MNAEERDLDLALADADADNKKLKARIVDLERTVNAAQDMVDALNGLSDYATWNQLLGKLEKELKQL